MLILKADLKEKDPMTLTFWQKTLMALASVTAFAFVFAVIGRLEFWHAWLAGIPASAAVACIFLACRK